MEWLLLVAGVACLFYIGAYVFPAYRISRWIMCPGDITPISDDEIPAEYQGRLKDAVIWMQPHGFTPVCSVRRPPVIKGTPWGLNGQLMFSESTQTWALVYVEPIPTPAFAWRLILLSATSAGQYRVTEVGDGIITDMPVAGFEFCNAMTCLPEELLAAHRRQINGLEFQTITQAQALDAFEMAFFQSLVVSGCMYPKDEGYQIPFKVCLTVMKNYRAAQKHFLEQRKRQPQTEHQPDSAAQQWMAYQHFQALQKNNSAGWLSKTGLLIASVALFSISFGFHFSLHQLAWLVVVLFVHELGHLLAMRAFGYKDLQMLFIPFLGAIASGKKEKISAPQEAIILLAGPLPGYVAGVFLLASGLSEQYDWVGDLALMSLLVNGFNLLPFNPLDGGKLVSLALLSRRPYLHFTLSLLSLAAFVHMALSMDTPFMWILVGILILATRHQWLEARFLSHLLSSGEHYKDLGEALDRLVQHPQWSAQSQNTRWSLLGSLNPRLQNARTGLVSATLILGLWAGSIVVPPALALSEEQRDLTLSILDTAD